VRAPSGTASDVSPTTGQPIAKACTVVPLWAEEFRREHFALKDDLKQYVAGFFEQAVRRSKQELKAERVQEYAFWQDRIVLELGKTWRASSMPSDELASLRNEVQGLTQAVERQEYLLRDSKMTLQETRQQVQNLQNPFNEAVRQQQAMLEANDQAAKQQELSQSSLQPSWVETVKRGVQQSLAELELRMADRFDGMQEMYLARLDAMFKEFQAAEKTCFDEQAARLSTSAVTEQDCNVGDPLVKMGRYTSMPEVPTEAQMNDRTKTSQFTSQLMVVKGRNTVSKSMTQLEGFAMTGLQSENPDSEISDLYDDGPIETSVEKTLRCVNYISCLLVVVNAIYMGIHVDVSITAVRQDKEPSYLLGLVDHMFTGSFIVELGVRLALERRAFFTGVNAGWNLLDTFAITLQIFEALQIHNLRNTILVRIIRACRIMRTVRALRTLKSLRILRLIMALEVWLPLFWGVAMLVAVVYLFAVSMATLVMDYIETNEDLPNRLLELYGSVSRTQYTLFLAVSGGEAWGQLLKPFEAMSSWNRLLFVIYIVFLIFGVMNILSAVYMDTLLHASTLERDTRLSERTTKEKFQLRQLRMMLKSQPLNEEGLIQRKHLLAVLTGEGAGLLKGFGLQLPVAKALFRMLDVEDSRAVEVDEYINGLVHLKGNATTIHMASLMYQSKRMLFKMQRISALVEDRVVPLLLGKDLKLLEAVSVED